MPEKMRPPSNSPNAPAHDLTYPPMETHNAAAKYQHKVEEKHAGFISAVHTPFDASEQVWSLEHGHRGYEVENSGHEWQPGPGLEQYATTTYLDPYPVHRFEIAKTQPLTPPASQRNKTVISKNRGTSVARTTPSSRSTTCSPAATKGRKTKTSASEKVNNVSLKAPLSILTSNSKIPLKNMEAFVHRSKEERVKQREKKNGYIVRPMNAFMLYRSAYAERAKGFFNQKNHQLVSKATGQSWKLESKDVQDYYKTLSEIERENHQKAWPDYKFSPSKATTANTRKRKAAEFSSDEEATERDPSDQDWTPSGSRKQRNSRPGKRRHVREAELATPYHDEPHYGIPIERSEFSYTNPGRPLPVSIDELNSLEPDAPYYVQSVRPYAHGLVETEDVRFERGPYGSVHIPAGLPGANQDDLFEIPYSQEEGMTAYGYVDPKIEAYPHSRHNGMFTEDGFAEFHGDILAQQVQNGSPDRSRTREQQHQSLFEMLTNDSEGFQKWVEHENQS